MPFAINSATRFISPTKTPEYLAAGRPVVSTPIFDVVRQYGKLKAVAIASTATEFVAACERFLKLDRNPKAAWHVEAEMALSQMSWDNVVQDMGKEIHAVLKTKGQKDLYYDYLIVGAGFAGSVMAERLASDAGKRVLVVDRRDHIAGNAFDRLDDAGIMIHQYGPHIFHTNSQEIVDYLSKFTGWRPYEHRVLAQVDGQLVPVPINRTTLNAVYGVELTTDDEAQAFLQDLAEPVPEVRTSEDVVVSQVGRNLYRKFFQGYTRKQWGLDPSELDKSVTSRIPTRTNTDDRYFTDTFQAMPAEGYTAMFKRMLDHPNITVATGVEYRKVRDSVAFGHLIFTGPIDEFFDHCYGQLPYRSLGFKHETIEAETFQPTATVNYPSEDVPYTRITEYKYLTGQESPVTSITYEYPQAEGDPYYPIPRAENAALFKRYEALALGTPNVTFVGRLATYRYYNMDQVVGQALSAYRRIRAKHGDTASGDAADTSSDGRSRQASAVSQGAQTTADAK
jgi:UDP-galactopyranose mutase